MGTLVELMGYIAGRDQVLAEIEEALLPVQAKYETYFAEVTRVRESELGQLRDLLRKGDGVPAAVREQIAQATAEESRRFDEKLAELEKARRELEDQAEEVRRQSLADEEQVKKANQELNAEEEELKARNARLLRDIDAYNTRLRALGRGFGFFTHLFQMGAVQLERRRLDGEQADVAARIEALRLKWQEREGAHTASETERQEQWVKLSTQALALAGKIELLRGSKERTVERSALEKVLFTRTPALTEPKSGDPACPRCKQPNAPACHFCRLCGQRLSADHPDLAGSLEEIAEVNRHQARFAEGMAASQELIGLVGGLRSGLAKMHQSVRDMQTSQIRYSLKVLAIDVPQKSLAFGAQFDALLAKVGEEGLPVHPKEFADQVKPILETLASEPEIKGFFEAMGEELSRRAKSQW
jgi:DNA repair exonuclease SbcCD ATPase subunit